MQREVIKWLQALDLTYPVRNPHRDLANGFTAAEIVSSYADSRTLNMAAVSTGVSAQNRRDNWSLVLRALQELHCTTVNGELVEAVLRFQPNAAQTLLEDLYEFFTKRKLPARTLDAAVVVDAAAPAGVGLTLAADAVEGEDGSAAPTAKNGGSSKKKKSKKGKGGGPVVVDTANILTEAEATTTLTFLAAIGEPVPSAADGVAGGAGSATNGAARRRWDGTITGGSNGSHMTEDADSSTTGNAAAVQQCLALTRNEDLSGGLKALQEQPSYARATAAAVVRRANNDRFEVSLNKEKYTSDEAGTRRLNERLVRQHEVLQKVLKDQAPSNGDTDAKGGARGISAATKTATAASTASTAAGPASLSLVERLRGRQAQGATSTGAAGTSSGATAKKQNGSGPSRGGGKRVSGHSETDMGHGARPGTSGTTGGSNGIQRITVNVLNQQLSEALARSSVAVRGDVRAEVKSVDLFRSCGWSVRLGCSSILKDVLAAHHMLGKMVEWHSVCAEGDILDDVFSCTVAYRAQLPLETLRACWSALEQNASGMATALEAQPSGMIYLLQCLSFAFTSESAQTPLLHVTAPLPSQDDTSVSAMRGEQSMTTASNALPGPLESPSAPWSRSVERGGYGRRQRSQSVGYALLAAFRRSSLAPSMAPATVEGGGATPTSAYSRHSPEPSLFERSQPPPSPQRGFLRDTHALHLASAFVFLSKVCTALTRRNPDVAVHVLTHYVLPHCAQALLTWGSPAIVEAVARLVASCLTKETAAQAAVREQTMEAEQRPATGADDTDPTASGVAEATSAVASTTSAPSGAKPRGTHAIGGSTSDGSTAALAKTDWSAFIAVSSVSRASHRGRPGGEVVSAPRRALLLYHTLQQWRGKQEGANGEAAAALPDVLVQLALRHAAVGLYSSSSPSYRAVGVALLLQLLYAEGSGGSPHTAATAAPAALEEEPTPLWQVTLPFIQESVLQHLVMPSRSQSRAGPLPAMEVGDSLLSTSAGTWEVRVLALELLLVLFRRLAATRSAAGGADAAEDVETCEMSSELSDERTEGEDDDHDASADRGGPSHRTAAPNALAGTLPKPRSAPQRKGGLPTLQDVEGAAERILRTFFGSPPLHRQLALSVVGRRLLPELQPRLASTWVNCLARFSDAQFAQCLLPYEEVPLEIAQPAIVAAATDPKRSKAVPSQTSSSLTTPQHGRPKGASASTMSPSMSGTVQPWVGSSGTRSPIANATSSLATDAARGSLVQSKNKRSEVPVDSTSRFSAIGGVNEMKGTVGASSTSSTASSIHLLLGRVEPVYVVTPLNQTWDTSSIVQVALQYVTGSGDGATTLTPARVLSIVSAALLSPQGVSLQQSRLLRNLRLTYNASASAAAGADDDEGSKEELFCTTLRELVVTGHASEHGVAAASSDTDYRTAQRFLSESPSSSSAAASEAGSDTSSAKHGQGGARRGQGSSNGGEEDDVVEALLSATGEEEAEASAEKATRAFWLAVLRRLRPLLRAAIQPELSSFTAQTDDKQRARKSSVTVAPSATSQDGEEEEDGTHNAVAAGVSVEQEEGLLHSRSTNDHKRKEKKGARAVAAATDVETKSMAIAIVFTLYRRYGLAMTPPSPSVSPDPNHPSASQGTVGNSRTELDAASRYPTTEDGAGDGRQWLQRACLWAGLC